MGPTAHAAALCCFLSLACLWLCLWRGLWFCLVLVVWLACVRGRARGVAFLFICGAVVTALCPGGLYVYSVGLCGYRCAFYAA